MSSNIEAEQQVLGILLNKPSIVEDRKLLKQHFTISEHRDVYEAVRSLYEDNIDVDIVSVVTWLTNNNKPTDVEYLTSVIQSVFTNSNYEYYFNMIEEERQKRVLYHIQKSIDKSLNSNNAVNVLELIDLINETLEKVNLISTESIKSMSDLDSESYQSMLDMDKTGIDKTLLSSGYPSIDYFTTGLKRTALYILAARPAVGKTALALNLAKSTATINKKNVVIFSLEMSASELYERILVSTSGVNTKKKRYSDLNEEEKQKDINARSMLKERGIFVEDSSVLKVSEMKLICKKVLREKGELGLVIVDYLQLIEPKSTKENRQVQVSQISRELKQLAKELNVCVLTLSQLSRNVESREGGKPKLSDLRDSGAIEADADTVMLMYREDYQKEDGGNISDVELSIAKNRHGKTGLVKLKFDKSISRFYEQR